MPCSTAWPGATAGSRTPPTRSASRPNLAQRIEQASGRYVTIGNALTTVADDLRDYERRAADRVQEAQSLQRTGSDDPLDPGTLGVAQRYAGWLDTGAGPPPDRPLSGDLPVEVPAAEVLHAARTTRSVDVFLPVPVCGAGVQRRS